jgi:hypothetical protein
VNKLSKGLIFSTIFHLMILVIFTQPFSQAPLPIIIKNNPGKLIQARLYFSSVAKQSNFAFETVPATIIKKSPKDKAKSKTQTQTVKKIPLKREATTTAKILPKQINNKEVLTNESSSKSISQTSLRKLRQRLNNQASENAQNDNFNQYLTHKNTIAPSITRFNQQPDAKAKVKQVDCNNSKVNIVITEISNLLGGSVRCNSMPDLKDFLDKRKK